MAIMLAGLLGAASAMAQPPPCEISRTGPIGEVIASVGAGRTISWVVEPIAGDGEESPQFARPGLLVDFDVARGGVLEVSGVMTSVTRVQDIGAGAPPPLSRVKLRAALDGGAPLVWAANDPETGDAALARQLKAAWPRKAELAVLLDGAIVARAVFDLALRPEAERIGRAAMATCPS